MLLGWEDNDITLLYQYQPIFFAPFFTIRQNGFCNYVFNEDVEIHPSHYHFESHTTHNPVKFALKEIPTSDVDAYYQELSALEKAFPQIQKEKHLIKLLLTFQHGRKYYFLFEWADGNLEEYWKKFPEVPEHSIEQSIWMAQQCSGLATAVKRIHGLATWQRERRNDPSFLTDPSENEKEWGRHGDIKPNNILWFSSHGRESGLYVLSDLGLTRYYSSLTRSRVSPTSIDGCTEVYRPPEMDIPGQHICSKYDIWSLGCVFLELCTWWLGGFSSVKEFENQRAPEPDKIIEEPKYFFIPEQTYDAQAQLKPVVVEWIKKLRNWAKDDLFAGPMLDLIEKDMLVVNKHRRSAIDRVCAEISKIIEQLPSPNISVNSPPVSLTSAGCSVSTNSDDLGDDDSDKSYNPGHVNRYENDRKTTTSPMVETLVQHTDGYWDPGAQSPKLGARQEPRAQGWVPMGAHFETLEAFMSRIHVSIGYEALDEDARGKIWDNLFQKLKEDHKNGGPEILYDYDAKQYVKKDPAVKNLQWNGREIRNAFQTAVALAVFDSNIAREKGASGEDSIPEIKEKHLTQVVNMSTAFKKYITATHEGIGDADMAYKLGHEGKQHRRTQPTSNNSPPIINQSIHPYPVGLHHLATVFLLFIRSFPPFIALAPSLSSSRRLHFANPPLNHLVMDHLPVELHQRIFLHLDLNAVRNAALSCRILFNAVKGAETLIATKLLLRQIDKDVLPEAILALRSRRLGAPSLSKMSEFAEALKTRQPAPKKWCLTDALPLAQFHEKVSYLASQAAREALEKEPRLLMGGKLPDPTREEMHRFERAFYRYQIFCNVIGPDSLGAADLWAVFFKWFSTWENEQLACIHEHLVRVVSRSFNYLVDHDVTWGRLLVPYIYGRQSEYAQGLLVGGVERVYHLSRASDYTQRHALLSRGEGMHDGPSGVVGFLFYGLEQGANPLIEPPVPLSGMNESCKKIICGKPFYQDPDPGPASMWEWAYRNEKPGKLVARKTIWSHRQWAFPFWNLSRLKVAGLWRNSEIHGQWSIPDLEMEAYNTPERLELLDESRVERAKIWRAGGTGFYSPRDMSKVKWADLAEYA
ncbi:hypothetical protein GQX73_g6846 [Xylaria multiplex]|uniref:Protein kinase domain-containing protein n=1 Tax=Xylaria multiplex TaxID=323545 RepID=A0A7C8MS94_9PEZI|nr:hypothetical protein GQX73_g6846 [Xylaria multiplex]